MRPRIIIKKKICLIVVQKCGQIQGDKNISCERKVNYLQNSLNNSESHPCLFQIFQTNLNKEEIVLPSSAKMPLSCNYFFAILIRKKTCYQFNGNFFVNIWPLYFYFYFLSKYSFKIPFKRHFPRNMAKKKFCYLGA
jgi:hypothetical protein